jgi:cell division control protein 24
MAYAPLLRTNTAPIFPANGGTYPANTMSNAPRASQLSGSTAYGGSTASLASLSSATTAVLTSGPVIATTNIINQKADASRSLYQICVSLKTRLGQVPGFEPYLQQLQENAAQGPVESLWDLLRTGVPLLAIYNALQPAQPLSADDANINEIKRPKVAVFKFVQACLKDLNIAPTECFVINDVLGNDTTGFVKVRC